VSGIEVDRLAKRYRSGSTGVQALSDVSFSVPPGRSLALIGENGAGKSTTVRILATLLRPDEGTARVGGHDAVRDPASVRALLGVALQGTGVPRRQTARRLLRHHARLHGLADRAARARAEELIASFDLDAVADRRVATYSGGQRRRLDVALALVHRPRVVLLDEPTAALDLMSRRSVWRQLEHALESGTTLLFTTHDLREADERADAVAIIDRGRVVAHSTPQELKRRFGSQLLDLAMPGEADAQRALAALGRGRLVDRTRIVLPIAETIEAVQVIRHLDEHDVEVVDFVLREPSLDSVFDQVVGV
jgi:ABC-2 type transport system ATP-binding protein